MTGDDIGSLIYLSVLGCAVAGWFFVQNRDSMGKMAQQAAIWGLIFLGAIAAVGLWQDIRRSTLLLPEISSAGEITVPRSRDGHYYLTLNVNNAPIRFVVDTGATNIVLSRQDAEKAGIDVDGLKFLGQAMTANGMVRTASVRLNHVTLGPLRDENIRAYVNGGEQDGSLLGMDYLRLFSELRISGDQLILAR